ncbi:MAG TPA: hypothetical protein VFC19_29895 [Candidatus Limnocylindrales bacterium]|nr:hypothetical protein [Candidatus Limnocylindrales bacterium]
MVMLLALRTEWTKFRTVRSSGWLLVGVAGLTVSLSTLTCLSFRVDSCLPEPGTTCDVDTTRLALIGVYLGQVAAVILGVLVAGSEYATAMMHASLTAVPRRAAVFVAKAWVVLIPVLAAGLPGVYGALLAAQAIQPGNGFTTANGYARLSLTDPLTVRAGFGTVLYLGLVALLGLGIAMAVRSTVTAISTVLTLLFGFPFLAMLVSEPRWKEWLTEYSPMSAGLAVQATRGLDTLPVGPWQGLGVLAAYAGAALLMGGAAFKLRDA